MAVLKALQRTIRRGKRTRIGLDIGASGVRAVQLIRQAQSSDHNDSRSLKGFVVANTASADCSQSEPGASPVGGTGQDPATLLADRIRTVMRNDRGGRVGFRGKAVAAALTTPDVEFHTLELPAAALCADEAEAAQIVRFEVERLVSNANVPVETRYWALPDTTVPAPNAIGAGAAHEMVNATIEVCAKAGLTCTELDTAATALSRFGALLQTRSKDQVWGILDVGDRQARLVLCLEDTPVLVRAAGAGGRAWTQRIAEVLQVSFKAAEIHKRDHGIALTGRQSFVQSSTRTPCLPPYQGGEGGVRSELASLILGAVRADLTDLASEVKRSYEYILSCYPGRQAADLVLCGGGSMLHHFPEFMGNALGIPVRRASSYLQDESCRLRISTEPSAPLEVLAVAAGLAISEPGAEATGLPRGTKVDGKEKPYIRHSPFAIRHSLNLIPERVQASQVRRRHFRRWAACLMITAGVAVVPVGAHWMQHLRLDELRAQSDKLQSDLAVARAELKSAMAEANDAYLRVERAKGLRSKRDWSNMLAMIGSCLPKDCWLTSVATDPDVPSAAPPVRKPPPATDPAGSPLINGANPPASPLEKGGKAGVEPAVVTIDAPRKLRMTGEAKDATQPLSFVTRLKESQVFREVTLERSQREKPDDESNFRFELICEW